MKQKICSYANIRSAYLKALKGKRKTKAALLWARNVDINLKKIQSRLQDNDPNWGDYRNFTIYEPKERNITAASFAERIMHHAVINVVEEHFEKHFIYHTYACRKGKGTHAAVKYAYKKAKAYPWYVKLDVRKYFDSVDHKELKLKLKKLIKDREVWGMLCQLIDSYSTEQGKGLPIGNLTSQYFANFYLSSLDHYILEKLKAPAYARYMDDMLIFARAKEEGRHIEAAIRHYAQEKLKLSLKEKILAKTQAGIPFLGFLIKPQGIGLMQKSKRRVKKRFKDIEEDLNKNRIDETKASERAISVKAAIKLANAHTFCATILYGRTLWHEPRQPRRQLEQHSHQLHRRQPEQQQPV